jgi:hypothetical protein
VVLPCSLLIADFSGTQPVQEYHTISLHSQRSHR